MPRLSKEVKKAMAKAKRQVLREAAKPKPKLKRKKPSEQSKDRSPAGRWIPDTWGNQGEVYFDGKLYWLVTLKPTREPDVWDAVSVGASEEQWLEYQKKPNASLSKGQKLETLETENKLSSIPRTTKSTKDSKSMPQRKSHTKSGKTATHKKQK